MLKELDCITKIIEAKVTREVHEVERSVLFLLLKGAIGVAILIFLGISIFFWVSIFIVRIEVASLVTASIFIIAYALTSFIQSQIKKDTLYKNKDAEWRQIMLLIIAAFIEGLMSGKSVKEESGNDRMV